MLPQSIFAVARASDCSVGADRSLALIGLIVGFTPVFAGLIFRTYGYHVAPGWAEILRQMDLPFIVVEVLVIMWARERGLRLGAVVARLDRRARWALAIFLATFWISSVLVADQPVYSAVRASFWFVHIGFGFAVFHLAQHSTRTGLIWFAAALCAGLIVFLPLMAAHLLTAPPPSAVEGGKIIWSSAIPGCLSIRHLGIWSALVLSCAVGALYIEDLQRRHLLIACVILFCATATLFWSGTRAGVYGLGGAGLVLLAVLRRVPPWRTVLCAAMAAGLGLITSTLWLPPESAFGTFDRVNALPGADLEVFANGRLVLWMGMLKAFAASPLFGVGEGAVVWVVSLPEGNHVQPHNVVVQMLSSWGIIASAAAAYLVARILIVLHRAARHSAAMVFMMLLIDCLLIMSLADGVMYFSRFIMWFAAGGAIVLALNERSVPSIAANDPKRGDLALA